MVDVRPRLIGAAVLVALGSGCSGPQANQPSSVAAAPATYRTSDTMRAFWGFWDAHAKSDASVQVAAFKEMVVGANPELFEHNIIGGDPTKKTSDLDERLGPYLASLPARIKTMRNVSEQVATDRALAATTSRGGKPQASVQCDGGARPE